MNPPFRQILLPSAAALLLSAAAHADVKLPAIISDHMVLQQELPATVWGWADKDEKVSVKFGDQSADTAADDTGKWSIKFVDLKAGAAGDLTVSGRNSLTVKDVVVGEVWVASGQSNMEFRVSGAINAKDDIAAANFPQLRMFTVQRAAKAEPQEDCVGKWEVCTPETVANFSAVAFFFGRKLHQDLQGPIGLIHTSWGGTPAESWTPHEALAGDPDFKPILDAWERKVADYPKAREAYEEEMEKYREKEKEAKEAGKQPPQPPHAPQGGDATGSPSCLYNGMIAPLLPYGIRGAIWYQGESNAGQARLYRKLFPTMILSWRQQWGSEFPFLFVQLANFNSRHVPPTGQPENSNWAELREAQAMTLELPRTGMAVAIDIGASEDIHPKNKQEVGRRLALVAEASVYYRDQEFSGPLYSDAQAEDGKMRLSFRHAEGLKAKEGGKLKGFAIAGSDKKFFWADAEVQGDHIVVSSPEVKEPAAVRYAWADDPECNLVNATGLPASPFRTDDWPQR
ncbi:MAG: sialate O-acetylesterase [Chthoniobacter sp.]|jgi:sialate O-acetylesterase|nr:sialate O-acetylesterase [Chthoniobacter sp.]